MWSSFLHQYRQHVSKTPCRYHSLGSIHVVYCRFICILYTDVRPTSSHGSLNSSTSWRSRLKRSGCSSLCRIHHLQKGDEPISQIELWIIYGRVKSKRLPTRYIIHPTVKIQQTETPPEVPAAAQTATVVLWFNLLCFLLFFLKEE